MAFLYYLSYAATTAAAAFVVLSLASGLLYISELIEEHSRLAKTIGQRGIYIVIGLHILLYFTETLPLSHIAFSVFCHIVYLQNFSSTWPLISLSSLSFIASCILVVADHFLWFHYFSQITYAARHQRSYTRPPVYAPGFAEIATFFAVCVWFTPLFLFLSLSANDNAIPMSAGPTSAKPAPSRVSLFRSILSTFDLPRIRPKGSRRNSGEGIIAPHSPTTRSPNLSPVSSRPSSPLSPTFTPPPPRSPQLDGAFALQAPPQRSNSASLRGSRRTPSTKTSF